MCFLQGNRSKPWQSGRNAEDLREEAEFLRSELDRVEKEIAELEKRKE